MSRRDTIHLLEQAFPDAKSRPPQRPSFRRFFDVTENVETPWEAPGDATPIRGLEDVPFVLDPDRREEDVRADLARIAEDKRLGPLPWEARAIRDVLAVYAPYAYYGDLWGIYWNEMALMRHSASVALKVPSLSFKVAWDILRALVRIHELFHHTIERCYAIVGPSIGQPELYRDRHGAPRRSELEEVLATALQHRCHKQVKHARLPAALRPALFAVLDATPYTGPYAHWRKASTPSGWRNISGRHAQSIGVHEAIGRLYLELHARGVPRNGALVVPEYRYLPNGVFREYSLFLR
jgi:hypothetical protein